MRVESLNKAKYYVSFIDDSSRWCEIRFLRSKDEAFEKFQEFKKLEENQKEKRIKCIQSDNGTEYKNKFDDYTATQIKKSSLIWESDHHIL